MEKSKTIKIGIDLEGYEEVKNQLKDIEEQLDRIINKREILNEKDKVI